MRESDVMRSVRHLLCGALIAMSAIGMFAAPSGATATVVAPAILLALGDSLAAGYQPADGTTVLPPLDPATGFRDRGYSSSYPADIATARGLRLIDLACPGETTESMFASPARQACAALYSKKLGATSQLAAAERFLSRNTGHVALVTLDIGANDLDRCVSARGADLGCLESSDVSTVKRLAAIVRALVTAVRRADPAAVVVAMNYYDPFLGLAYAPGGSKGAALAAETLAATDIFNSQLDATFHNAGVKIADVASAFDTHATTPKVRFAGAILPRNVASVCTLTWMCPSPKGKGQDPNAAGYEVIASAFETALRA
jgi:lysophospholipase L1-like esterase